MYNLHQFLHFNKVCPICQNPLTLYLQWIESACFKSTPVDANWYNFEQFKIKRDNLEGEHITIFDHPDESEIRFSSSDMATEAKRRHMYFFYLCTENGMKDLTRDYEINIYKGCYWRSTPLLELKKFKDDTHWKLTTVNPDDEKHINADEVFSFKKKTIEDVEKIYTLDLNYIESATDFMYYTVDANQAADDAYEPNIFDKHMPMIGSRPDFSRENRDKLMDRFDSWVIIS